MVTICCGEVQFHQIQAVIFDKDGTLADSATFLKNLGWKRSRLIDAQVPGVQEPLLMAFGIDQQVLNPAGLMAVGTRYENEIAAAAYVAETGRDWAEARELVHNAFVEADQRMQRKADETPLLAGTLDLVRSLSTAGVKLGILSSDTVTNIRDFVVRYDLTAYFPVQIGGDRPPFKPDPILLQTACAALAVPPEAVLLIGDSQMDIQLAQRGGAAGCIGVTWGWGKPLRLDGAGAIATHPGQIQVLA